MSPLWLYLHFPNLQLDSLYVGIDSQQPEAPVAVFNDKENAIVQLNQPARQCGIQVGMGLATASALASDLQVVAYQPQLEQDKLNQLAEHLYLKTADISLFPPDGLLLRVHNMLALYGDLPSYWQGLQQHLSECRVHYHYATGPSGYAAKVLARLGHDQVSDNKAKMFAALGRCALSYTDIRPGYVDKLKRVGIHAVGDILKLPLKEIAQRFDIELLTYLGRLKGELHHPLEFFHPTEKFSRFLELLYEVEASTRLLAPLQKLLTELSTFLQLRNLVTQTLHLKLYQRDTDAYLFDIGSAQGESSCKSWLALANLKLESVELAAPVYAIELSTGPLQRFTPQEAGLFDKQRKGMSPAQLVSMLQAKLGDQSVKGLRFVADHRPEKACLLGEPGTTANTCQSAHRMRPAFLLDPPCTLHVAVKLLQGPERLISGWWDDQPVTRDYFIARCEQGRLLWVYRTGEYKWYLHGLFS